jgi:hypothetical protein
MHSRIPLLLVVSALLGLPGFGGLAQKNPTPSPGPDLKGDRWQGTMHSGTEMHSSKAACTGEAWDFDLHLVVGGDGSVEGKATGHLTSMPQCSGPPYWVKSVYDGQAKNSGWNVSGEFDGKQFKLHFAETQIDGGTGGLIQYSLWTQSGVVNTIVVPLTSKITAQGETKTNVPVPHSTDTVASGDHTVTLKRDCDPLTPEAVTQAILKALKEHHITLPSFWHGEAPGRFVHNLQPKGYYPNGPEPYSLLPNEVGFLVLPEQHSDILIIGTAKAPCKGSSDGSIIVDLMIWETRVVDGKRFPYGMIEEVTGSGDVSQKGLDDAMRKAFDAAKLDQYKSSGPPS